MAVKYSGLLKFTDEIKAEIDLAADGAVEKAVIIDGEGAETPIGGGASDFTTAEVTINSAKGDEGTVLLMPNIEDSDRRTGIQVFEVTAKPNTPKTYNVPLFKGHCFIKVNSGEVNDLTGNVTSLGNGLDVTGNCSLIAYYVMH